MIRRFKSQRQRIKRRIRSRMKGTPDKPRISVLRSGRYIYAQLIDDIGGRTLCSANDKKIFKGQKRENMTKTERAFEVGKSLAAIALENGKKAIVFDRSGYKYHGRVKSLADGLREGGLEF